MIPQPRKAEATEPTPLIRQLVGRLSRRARIGIAIATVLVVEIAGAALYFRSASLRAHRGEPEDRMAAMAAPFASARAPAPSPPPPSPPERPASAAAAEESPAPPPPPPPPADEVVPSPPLAPLPVAVAAQKESRPARSVPRPIRTVAIPRPATASAPGSAPAALAPAGPSAQSAPSLERPSDTIDQATPLTVLAEHAFQAGRQLDAVRLARKSLAAGGGARAKLVLAEAYFDLRLFREARDAYADVLAEQPGNQVARVGHDLADSEWARTQRK
jgi:type IV secretory pathway VirB10-like protein